MLDQFMFVTYTKVLRCQVFKKTIGPLTGHYTIQIVQLTYLQLVATCCSQQLKNMLLLTDACFRVLDLFTTEILC